MQVALLLCCIGVAVVVVVVVLAEHEHGSAAALLGEKMAVAGPLEMQSQSPLGLEIGCPPLVSLVAMAVL